MIAAQRDRLIAEGRTHWFCVEIDVGRRFAHTTWVWARDAEDAAARVTLRDGQTITAVTEQHR